jgi:hypothetical protein
MSQTPFIPSIKPTSGILASLKAQSQQLITTIRENPFWGSFTIELVGANFMGVLCVGNMAERVEQCIMQFGNTLQTFIGGLFFEKLLDAGYKKTIPNLHDALKTEPGKAWYKFGKTMAMFGYITPFMLMLPKIRDIYTLKTTGAITFDEMTGITPFDREDPTHKAKENETIRQKWHQLGAVVGTGFTAGMALYATAGWAIANKKNYPKWLNNVERMELPINHNGKPIGLPYFLVGDHEQTGDRSVFLKDGKFSNFEGGNLMMAWVLPGYTGWLLSPRGVLGVCEDVFKASCAVAGFSGLKSGVVKKFESFVESKPFLKKGFEQWLGNEKNQKHFSKEFIGTVLYAIPVLLNFHSRSLRANFFGFKGNQHDIPTITLEQYDDEAAQLLKRQMQRKPTYFAAAVSIETPIDKPVQFAQLAKNLPVASVAGAATLQKTILATPLDSKNPVAFGGIEQPHPMNKPKALHYAPTTGHRFVTMTMLRA